MEFIGHVLCIVLISVEVVASVFLSSIVNPLKLCSLPHFGSNAEMYITNIPHLFGAWFFVFSFHLFDSPLPFILALTLLHISSYLKP